MKIPIKKKTDKLFQLKKHKENFDSKTEPRSRTPIGRVSERAVFCCRRCSRAMLWWGCRGASGCGGAPGPKTWSSSTPHPEQVPPNPRLTSIRPSPPFRRPSSASAPFLRPRKRARPKRPPLSPRFEIALTSVTFDVLTNGRLSNGPVVYKRQSLSRLRRRRSCSRPLPPTPSDPQSPLISRRGHLRTWPCARFRDRRRLAPFRRPVIRWPRPLSSDDSALTCVDASPSDSS